MLSFLIYFHFNFLNIHKRHFIFAFHCSNPQNNGNLTQNFLAEGRLSFLQAETYIYTIYFCVLLNQPYCIWKQHCMPL